jgi:hypothetical protein
MASYAYTFTSGDTVTPTKLNNARTVSEIVNADIKSDAAIAGSKLENGAITDAKVSASAAIALSKLATGSLPTAITVASANLVDGTIVNADVNASAAIAGTKISPDFGSQNIATTGTLSTGVGSVVSGSGSGDALRITQTGAGNALVVEDSTNPDSSPFVVDASGNVVVGKTTANSRLNIAAADNLTTTCPLRVDNHSNNYGFGIGAYRISNRVGAAQTIDYNIDIGGTLSVDTNGAEAFKIQPSGRADVFASSAGVALGITGTNLQGASTNCAVITASTFGSSATVRGVGFAAQLGTQAASFTLDNLIHFRAVQGTIGAGSTVTNQFGVLVDSSLTGATNNFGVYSDIASGSGRWNFYANGTANNYFAGTVAVGTTSPNSAALLDVASTTRGFLPPRMTTAQRDAISAPPAGLMVYNTTTNKLNVRTASSWEAVTSS